MPSSNLRPRIVRTFVCGAYGVLLAIASGLVFVRLQSAQLRHLRHVAALNSAEGRASLEAGRFDDAKLKLTRAVEAYKQLGSADIAALETTQLAREAAIHADLCAKPLGEIVWELTELQEPARQSRFDAHHKGKSIIINDVVDSAAGDHVKLRGRIIIGGGSSRHIAARIDTSNFALFKGSGLKVGQRVLFGARLDSIRWDESGWTIEFGRDSGVWMKNRAALDFNLPGSN